MTVFFLHCMLVPQIFIPPPSFQIYYGGVLNYDSCPIYSPPLPECRGDGWGRPLGPPQVPHPEGVAENCADMFEQTHDGSACDGSSPASVFCCACGDLRARCTWGRTFAFLRPCTPGLRPMTGLLLSQAPLSLPQRRCAGGRPTILSPPDTGTSTKDGEAIPCPPVPFSVFPSSCDELQREIL